MVYGQAFFPFLEPVAVDAGDHVSVALRAQLVGSNYVWSWITEVRAGHSEGAPKAHFKQSTLAGTPVSTHSLHRRAMGHTPGLGLDGRIVSLALQLMNGQRPLGAVAEALAEAFPDRFPDVQSALDRVGELAQKYAQTA
jgi:protein arginine N-methyltransferase 1